MSDQAVGFLLEFRNEASAELKQAKQDFDEAAHSLEEAVDAAMAAFTFLEEGTGTLAKEMEKAIDSVVSKTEEVNEAVAAVASVEVKPPSYDPVRDAIKQLGEDLVEPIESGVEEVSDTLDDVNEKELQAPTIEQWVMFNNTAKDTSDTLEVVTESYVGAASAAGDYLRTLGDISDESLEMRKELRSSFDGVDKELVRAGTSIRKAILPGLRELGEDADEAASIIAGDMADAFVSLQQNAELFYDANIDAFQDTENVAELWKGFFDVESEDLQKVQDLLKIADKTDLQPLIENLQETLGDAALSQTFWGAIANNKTVDKEFFLELEKQFEKETDVYKTWWDGMTDSAKKFMWPIFQAQGSEAVEGIADTLKSKLKDAFSSPIGQFVAALQISNMITKVFGPALEMLSEIIGQALMPVIRMLSDFIEDLTPTIMELSIAFIPLFDAISLILQKLSQSLIPLFIALGEIVEALTPLIVMMVQAWAAFIRFQINLLIPVLEFVANAIYFVVSTLQILIDVVGFILSPLFKLIRWLNETFKVMDALGTVIGVVLIPAIIAWASTAIPAAITAVSGWIGVVLTHTAATVGNTVALIDQGLVMLGMQGGIGTLTVLTASWATSLWAATFAMFAGAVPAIISITAATWAFTVALLANPVTWIVLAIGAAIAAVAGLVWYFWDSISFVFTGFLDLLSPVWDGISALLEPIKAVFGSLLDFFSPIIDGLKSMWEWFSDLGIIADIIMAPFTVFMDALGWIGDSVSWILELAGMVPDWIKWLFGFDTADQEPEFIIDSPAIVDDIETVMDETTQEVEMASDGYPNWFKASMGIDTDQASQEIVRDAGNAYDTVGSDVGQFMIEGMTHGMLMLAKSFPLTGILTSMFGPFTGISGQAATPGGGVPGVSAVSVGEVDYEVEQKIDGDEMNRGVITALASQTQAIVSAIANSGDGGLDLELYEMKQIAEW